VQTTGVYREDTANTVAERLIKQTGLYAGMTADRRLKVRELAQYVEQEINSKIDRMTDEVKRYKAEMSKIQFAMA
jgi:uncharacterized small protein (DUF1192 family)